MEVASTVVHKLVTTMGLKVRTEMELVLGVQGRTKMAKVTTEAIVTMARIKVAQQACVQAARISKANLSSTAAATT